MDLIWSSQEIAPGGRFRTYCREFSVFRRIAPEHNADLCLGTAVRRAEQSCPCRFEPYRSFATHRLRSFPPALGQIYSPLAEPVGHIMWVAANGPEHIARGQAVLDPTLDSADADAERCGNVPLG